jgi:type I restriction enzyme S subunit
MFGDPSEAYERFPQAQLGEICRFIDYRGISPNKQPSGVRLVTARNIKRGWFEEEPKEFIPAEEYESWMSRGIPRTEDVLFTTEGHTLGSAAKLPPFEKAALAQRLIALQPQERISSDYLLQLILDQTFKKRSILAFDWERCQRHKLKAIG